MKKVILVAVGVVLTTLAAWPVFAHGPGRGMKADTSGPGYHMRGNNGYDHDRFQPMGTRETCRNDQNNRRGARGNQLNSGQYPENTEGY